MKKGLKILGILLLGLLLLAGAALTFVAFKPAADYSDTPLMDISIPDDSASIALGHKLVMMNCNGCHFNKENQNFSGYLFPDADSRAFGMVYTANITQHPEHGIGTYSEAELYRLFRTGVKRDGSLALPFMSRLYKTADTDVKAIIAFLQSDHPSVQPDDTQHPTYKPSFLAKMLATLVFEPMPYPESISEVPAATDPIAYGEYLVQSRYECYGCHSTDISQVDLFDPPKTPGYLAGGHVFHAEYPHESYEIATPSLLSTSQALNWGEDGFVDAVMYGKRPTGKPFQEPMHPFSLMDTTEARAIYQYLRSYTPPVEVSK